MNIERLVMMVNQIAAFHRRKGDAAGAEAVAEHLRKYWEPRMRVEIMNYVRAGGAGLEGHGLRGVMELMVGEAE